MPDTATPPAPPAAKRTGRQLLVRALSKGWYHASPGTFNGMADKHGWSIHQHPRDPGDVFLIRHEGHFAGLNPDNAAIHGWMEWADTPSQVQPEPPIMTATRSIQDPLSIENSARMVPVPGDPHGRLVGPTPNQMAENMAISGIKEPGGSHAALNPAGDVAKQPHPRNK